jgi:hypothetical protein
MKFFHLPLAAILLFVFVGFVQAEDDPIVGTYNCLGRAQEGCGEDYAKFYPPRRIEITKSDDGVYQLCVYYRRGDNPKECMPVDLGLGEWEWSSDRDMGELSISSRHMITFKGSSINYQEDGGVYGRLTCDLHLQAVCTK